MISFLSRNTVHFETESNEQGIEMEHMKIEEYQKNKFTVALPPVQDPFTEHHSKPFGLGKFVNKKP